MKDVAKMAGVSVSTVSRVINNNIPVDKQTRQKVEDAIKLLRFKPSLVAKGLRMRSGRVIGLVVPDVVHHHAFVKIINAVQQMAFEHEYALILGTNRNSPEVEEYIISNLIRRNVDGIIFSRVSDQSGVLRLLHETQIPIAVVDRILDHESVPSVAVDNAAAGQMAAQHLLGLGHQRIACITGPLNIALCRERLAAFQAALLAGGVKLDGHFVFQGDFSFDAGMSAVEQFFAKLPHPTAIWAQNDRMAAGALKRLASRSLAVPGDVSLMGMDDIDLAELLTPGLTTIRQPFEEMGRLAVEIVLGLRKSEDVGSTKITLQPSLVVRESTAAVPTEHAPGS